MLFAQAFCRYVTNVISKYLVQKGHDTTILTSELDKVPDGLVGFFGKEGIEIRIALGEDFRHFIIYITANHVGIWEGRGVIQFIGVKLFQDGIDC